MSLCGSFIRTSKLTISTTTSLSVGAWENMIAGKKSEAQAYLNSSEGFFAINVSHIYTDQVIHSQK
jgi:predicted secreted protein